MEINDVKKFDQQLSLIFHFIIAGPLVLYSIAYIQTLGDNPSATFQEPSLILKLFVSIFCGALVLGAFVLYKKEITSARKMGSLKEKLSSLMKGSIIQYGLLEMASFIAALAFFLTYDHLFTAVYVFILFMMSLNRPSPRKYVQDLYLKDDERDIVLNKGSIS